MVALHGAFLGGAVETWSVGLAVMLVGLCVVIYAPELKPRRGVLWAAAGLVLCSVLALLPVVFWPVPAWRTEFAALGVHLPWTLSPQPQLVVAGLPALLAGLLWWLWLDARGWHREERSLLARVIVIVTAALAVWALLGKSFGWAVPGWQGEKFGPFPNRNHTANFLLVGGLVGIGGAAHAWRERRYRRAGGLMVAVLCILAGLIAGYSRAGIGLFFLGATVLVLLIAWKGQKQKVLVLGASGVLLLCTFFFVFGGATLERFFQAEGPGLGFRKLIFTDALRMSAASPVFGVGMGSFAGVFPQFQQVAMIQQGVLHPESDWLQLACESGWIAVLFVAAGVVVMVRGWFPMESGSALRVRFAGAIAAGAFLVHSLVDVPGHRMGSMLPALLAASLAMPYRPAESVSVWARGMFRIAGLVVFLLGAWMLTTGWGKKDRLENAAGIGAEARLRLADEALARKPLDWRGYYQRGIALFEENEPLRARLDFKRARFLEPHFGEIAMAEGFLWAKDYPAFALEAWREGLRRMNERDDLVYFVRMLEQVNGRDSFRRQLRELAGDRNDLLVPYLRMAPAAERRVLLDELMPRIDQMSEEDRRMILRLSADSLAEFEQFQDGYQIFKKSLTEFPLPPPVQGREDEMRLRWARDRTDFAAAYTLFTMKQAAGDREAALLVLMQADAQKTCPPYLRQLAGDLLAGAGRWSEALEILRRASKPAP